ncbi:hypothetical protein KSF_085300 [Reticulibacter mediterranei]|uniref:Uncharacterized protein n=1 Tax=Reticulibacter mediterranei TaxID=2778369 RepID=A0A8J3N4R1_9CHLR|nr:hypothetical protein KSF_085300 [Reticulibacter mediterranei]
MLVQYLPAGFLLASNSGVEVATDEGVTVPAAHDAPSSFAVLSLLLCIRESGDERKLLHSKNVTRRRSGIK